MVTYEITFMADPGDGILSKNIFVGESDDMARELAEWQRTNDYFVIKCEIVSHPLKD